METDSLHFGKTALGLVMLVALLPALLAFLPGIAAIPAIDRDEARFAQASRQMLESGDFITPRFQEELRAKKPVGIYWMQAASAAVFGDSGIAPYRVPGVIGAIAVVMLGFGLALHSLPPPYALIAAGFMGSSVVLATEAHLAKTDAVLCALVLLQQIILWKILRQARGGGHVKTATTMAFWAAMGAAILVKGPIAPAIAAGTCAFFALAHRKDGIGWRAALRPGIGGIALAVIVLPWVVLVSYSTDGVFIMEALRGDLFSKIQSGQESHGAPPLTHLAILAITFWPGSLLFARGVLATWQHRKNDHVIFLLGWVIPFWVLIEFTPTKLPHYFLPVMPALAILLAFGIDYGSADRMEAGGARLRGLPKTLPALWQRLRATNIPNAFVYLWDGVFILASLLLGGAVLYATYILGGAPGWGAIAFLLTLLVAGLGVFWIWQRHNAILLGMVIAASVFHAVVFGGVLPSLDGMHLAPRIKAAIERIDPAPGSIAVAGYHEPSLVFALGTDTLLFDGADVAFFLGEASGGIGVVESSAQGAFLAAAARAGITLKREARITGYNISRGEEVTIGIYRRAD